MWNGEQLQLLPCQQCPSIQLKMPTHCILNYSHPEWSLTLAFMTGEKSLITLGWWWKVLLFVAFLWILRKLTMFYEFLAQCHVPIQRKNFPWLTKTPLWIPKRYNESTFWWIKYKWNQIVSFGNCIFLAKSWMSMYSRYCQIQKRGKTWRKSE